MTSPGRDDLPEGDAVEQRLPADPDAPGADSPIPDDLPGGLSDADPADALDQWRDAAPDDEDDRTGR